MSIFKVSIWALIVITVDFIVGIINQKIYATFVGNEGLVLIGNFNNVMNILLLLGSGGILSGITKVVAHKGYQSTWKHIFALLVATALITSIVAAIFFPFIKQTVVPKGVEVHPLALGGLLIALPLMVIYTGYMHLLMGLKKVKTYSLFRISQQIVNLISTFILTVTILFNGVVLSSYVPSILMFLVLMIAFKNVVVKPEFSNFSQAKTLYKELAQFSLATFISTILLYSSQLFIRNYVSVHLSVEEASYWQVLVTLSRMWLAFFSFIIVTYLFPQMASIQDIRIARQKAFRLISLLLLGTSLVGLILYMLRNALIILIYNNDFLEATNYFHLQIIADIVKIAGLSFAYYSLAKGWIRLYILSEIIYYSLWIFLGTLLLSSSGLKGIFYAQIVAISAYSLLLGIYFTKGK